MNSVSAEPVRALALAVILSALPVGLPALRTWLSDRVPPAPSFHPESASAAAAPSLGQLPHGRLLLQPSSSPAAASAGTSLCFCAHVLHLLKRLVDRKNELNMNKKSRFEYLVYLK